MIYLIQQQTDDKAENWGPVVPINYNKNETLQKHIAKLKSQKTDKIDNDNDS